MSAAVLQLHRRESFERNATAALTVGAGAGLLHYGLSQIGVAAPLPWLATLAAVLATLRGDRSDRILLGFLAVVVPSFFWLLSLSPAWTVGLGAGAAGMLMVRAHLCELGEEGQLASVRPGGLSYALGGVLGAGLGLAGTQVAAVLAVRLSQIDTPGPLAAALVGAQLSLFVALASISAHLALRQDPVEARCEELLPQLNGDFRILASRALELYRRCGAALAKIPRTADREELARTLCELTQGAVELASEWSGVEHELEERTQKELEQEISGLERAAQATLDALARRQLQLAAAALKEELERVEELKVRRERILAKLRAQVALLERARVSLIGIRSGQAQLRSAELSALARRFSSLSDLQGARARWVEEVATSAELDHQEAERAQSPL